MQHEAEACHQHASEEFIAYQEWFRANSKNVIDPEWVPAFYGDLDSHMEFLGKLTSREYFVAELEEFISKYGSQPPRMQC